MEISEFNHTVLHYLGFVLMIIGALVLLPILPAILYSEYSTIFPFVFAAALSLGLGFALNKIFRKGELTLSRAMVMTALTFISMSVVGAIPYIMLSKVVFGAATFNTCLCSLFEAVSGFTTTGLTVIPNIEAIPHSLLFWRSFTQWIGGVGIIVLFLTVLMGPGISSYYLYRGEAWKDRIEPSVKRTAADMVKVYLFYTAVGILVMFLLGMPVFESVVHTSSMVSTGGFSAKAASIGSYGSVWIETASVILMALGAISFALHYKILGGKLSSFVGLLKNKEVKLMFALLFLFAVALTLHFNQIGDTSPVRHGVFQTVTATTNSGFYNMPQAGMTEFSKTATIMMMFIGGSAGSTAGGLKIVRFMILLAAIPWLIRKYLLPPTAVQPLKIGKLNFHEKEVSQVTLYFFIYMLMIAIGALVITAFGYSFMDSLFETTSAAATVGLSSGITGFAAPIGVKVVLIFEMLMGRLEILPILALFGALLESRRWGSFYD